VALDTFISGSAGGDFDGFHADSRRPVWLIPDDEVARTLTHPIYLLSWRIREHPDALRELFNVFWCNHGSLFSILDQVRPTSILDGRDDG